MESCIPSVTGSLHLTEFSWWLYPSIKIRLRNFVCDVFSKFTNCGLHFILLSLSYFAFLAWNSSACDVLSRSACKYPKYRQAIKKKLGAWWLSEGRDRLLFSFLDLTVSVSILAETAHLASVFRKLSAVSSRSFSLFIADNLGVHIPRGRLCPQLA